MPHLFIAVDVSAEIRDALVSAQAPFTAQRLPVRWTKSELMHLTLLFLGDTDANAMVRIGDALKQSTSSIRPHSLHLGKLGAFPTLSRPKVIWCGVESATDELERLQSAIAMAVADIVPQKETRSFTPHLTIGRVRQDANTAERSLIGNAIAGVPVLPRISWRVDEVVLYESVPAPAGVQHVKRRTAPLGSVGTPP